MGSVDMRAADMAFNVMCLVYVVVMSLNWQLARFFSVILSYFLVTVWSLT